MDNLSLILTIIKAMIVRSLWCSPLNQLTYIPMDNLSLILTIINAMIVRSLWCNPLNQLVYIPMEYFSPLSRIKIRALFGLESSAVGLATPQSKCLQFLKKIFFLSFVYQSYL
jgi:hypothetical protein